jgi:tripartite-type tricarboxylate transporter receptor subunit TctC
MYPGFRTRLALAGAIALVTFAAEAQTRFPERPLRLVVPFAPGGVNDIVGRRYALELTRAIGQNVIVDNRAGASGAIGATEVARAKPDGHTLLIANTTTQVINRWRCPTSGTTRCAISHRSR